MRLSLLSSSRKTNQECCIRTDGGRQRVEDPHALIPNVGNEGRIAEVLTTFAVEERWMQVLKHIHRVRERHK